MKSSKPKRQDDFRMVGVVDDVEDVKGREDAFFIQLMGERHKMKKWDDRTPDKKMSTKIMKLRKGHVNMTDRLKKCFSRLSRGCLSFSTSKIQAEVKYEFSSELQPGYASLTIVNGVEAMCTARTHQWPFIYHNVVFAKFDPVLPFMDAAMTADI